MFPGLPGATLTRRSTALAHAGLSARPGNSGIPAGYTYLGQFIDHDVTYDPQLAQRAARSGALVNFRTPRLDLDSLYGSGPVDQPYLYEWNERVRSRGEAARRRRAPAARRRPAATCRATQQGRALIGDPRNDENAIIAQLHLLFIEFPQRGRRRTCARPAGVERPELFPAAQRIVRWHYQWIVAHDFLARSPGHDA